MSGADQVFAQLGLRVLERGWLSSNNIVFSNGPRAPAAVVDTGYATHAEQTVALVRQALGTAPLGLIVNTHLHSDHCGGNAALQAAWPEAVTWVPVECWSAVSGWDDNRLTFASTDQRCDRFQVDEPLSPGDEPWLGDRPWQVHAAPGHDPTALMFFEPQGRVLISGDALWERRLAIIFPELVGEPGFEACLQTLDAIERLAPALVIPGHGAPFTDVAAALAASRMRVEAFQQDPGRHARHAVRALVMFHMLEIGQCERTALRSWLRSTPITGPSSFRVEPNSQNH